VVHNTETEQVQDRSSWQQPTRCNGAIIEFATVDTELQWYGTVR